MDNEESLRFEEEQDEEMEKINEKENEADNNKETTNKQSHHQIPTNRKRVIIRKWEGEF